MINAVYILLKLTKFDINSITIKYEITTNLICYEMLHIFIFFSHIHYHLRQRTTPFVKWICVVICFKLNWAWNHCHQSWNIGLYRRHRLIQTFVTNYKGFKPKRATRRLQDYSHGTTFLGPNQIGKCKHLIITFTLNRVLRFYFDDMFLITSVIQNRTNVSWQCNFWYSTYS